MLSSQQPLLDSIQAGLNLISQAISIHDSDLKLVHANKRMQTMFQLPDELVQSGALFRDTVLYLAQRGEYGQLDDVEAFVDEKVSLALAFEPHYFERTRANGTSLSIEGCPLDSGGWITVFTDITSTKRDEATILSRADGLSKELVKRSEELAQSNREMAAAARALEATQQELIKSRARLQLINSMTPAHIAHVNTEGTYTYSNGRLPSVVPLAAKDIVGHQFLEVLGNEIYVEVMQSFEKALMGESSVSEFREQNSGRFIRLAMTPDIDESGSVQGAYILSTDVTEEVQARRALSHARRKALATQLTSVMTHDFSNLLTIIMGQQSQLEKLATDNPELINISQTIKAATGRGAELVDTLNHIETQRHIDAIKVNSSDFASNIERLARATVPKNFELEIHFDIPDGDIIIDPGFASDALLNMVINAMEACDATGSVTVRVFVTGQRELQFRVQDNGPGFSVDALKKALNPFYSTKPGKGGRGLGLTSAYDFARSCGGGMRIRNHEDGGALVVMTIPYKPASKAESTGDGQVVLVVDDDDGLRALMSEHLRSAGRMVIEAGSLAEASELVKVDGLTTVVTDLDLGRENSGLDVAAIVPDNVSILIVTGLGISDPRRQKAERLYHVLDKPFSLVSLDAALLQVTA